MGAVPFRVGNQRVEQDEADLLMLRLQGEVSADEARQLVLLDRQQSRRYGYSLVLIDASRVTGFGHAAKQAVYDEIKRHAGYRGSTALFGVAGPMIWFIKLVLRGLSPLARHIDDEIQIFSSEEEARAFVAERRLLRQQQAAQR